MPLASGLTALFPASVTEISVTTFVSSLPSAALAVNEDTNSNPMNVNIAVTLILITFVIFFINILFSFLLSIILYKYIKL